LTITPRQLEAAPLVPEARASTSFPDHSAEYAVADLEPHLRAVLQSLTSEI